MNSKSTVVLFISAVLVAACEQRSEPPPQVKEQPSVVKEAELDYIAELQPVNEKTIDTSVTGKARLRVQGDELTITVDAEGLPPNIMHLQHIHGYLDGRDAGCPPPEADTNDDGIIDLKETEAYTGVTLIPLHERPTSLQIMHQTYPAASAEGKIDYRQTVSLKELQQAFEKRYGKSALELEKRTVFIHGVPKNTKLPESVQSLEGVPAHVTLPIACGELSSPR